MNNKDILGFMKDFLNRPVIDRFDYVRLYNKPGFVDDLTTKYGATAEEVSKFFEFLCVWQIFLEQPLPTTGYLDLVRFAKDHRIFTLVEVLKRQGKEPKKV